MNDHRTTINYHAQTCLGCDSHVSHEFTIKVVKDGEGYWTAQGPYQTEEQAVGLITKTKELLEKKGESNRS